VERQQEITCELIEKNTNFQSRAAKDRKPQKLPLFNTCKIKSIKLPKLEYRYR